MCTLFLLCSMCVRGDPSCVSPAPLVSSYSSHPIATPDLFLRFQVGVAAGAVLLYIVFGRKVCFVLQYARFLRCTRSFRVFRAVLFCHCQKRTVDLVSAPSIFAINQSATDVASKTDKYTQLHESGLSLS